MPEYRLTRRGLVLGATVALAGCVSSGSDQGPPGTTGSEPTGAGSTSTTAAPATTAGESGAACATWEGATTPYDSSDTPFFFDYDYVASWTPEELTNYSRGHFVRFTSPAVGEDDFTLTLRVSQSGTAFTAAERDEEVEYFLDFEAEPREVVGEVTYDGETLRVLGLADVGDYYQPGLSVFLPYGSGSDRRYYPVGSTLFGGLGVAEADRPACIAAAEAAQSAVIQSLAPNPETAFQPV